MKRINNKRTGRFKAGIYAFIPIVLFLGSSSPVVGQSEYHTVQSADGTTIGFTKIGSGPVPVVIVHGALNTHEQWLPLATAMNEQFTCYVMDRWGRGWSDDRTGYSLKKEAEDIAAVLEEAGPDAFLLGHSSGAIYALESALLTPPEGLILYEPPILAFENNRFFEKNRDSVRIAADEERWEDMVSIFLKDEARISEEELTFLQASPFWEPMVDLAPVTAREWVELEEDNPTVSRYQNIEVPTLFLTGSENEDHPSFATQELNDKLPDSHIVILDGHGHSAHLDDPELVAKEITNFIDIDHQEIDKPSVEPKIMEVNGVGLHYIEKGDGTPVVFVHGAFGDYRTWHNQMEDFSKKYRTISYSRRYYHPNDIPIDSTYDLSLVHVNDLISFINSLKAGPVHLVGHSSGGWIAIHVAIRQPELVKTLVLGEPPTLELLEGDPRLDSIMNEIQSEIIHAIEAYSRDEDEEGTRLFLEMVTGDANFFDSLSSFDREIMMDNIAERKASLLVKNPKHKPLPLHCADIQRLNIPALIVGGENSPEWLTYVQDKLAACLQNNDRVTLPNTTHGLEFENPEDFNEAVLGFIEKN